MRQVTLIRGKILAQLRSLRVFISCLPEQETEAMSRLEGTEGNKTAERIANYVLQELGHQPSVTDGPGTTVRQVRKVFADGRR